jgi:hypothetical protein
MAKKTSNTVEVSGHYTEAKDRKGGPFDKYEVESALRTLSDAAKIRKNSKLMAAVKAHAREKVKEHSAILQSKKGD